MMRLRWLDVPLVVSLAAILGCGGSAVPTKGYDHFVAAAKALEAKDKDAAFAELSASIDATPTDWAYFERARLNLEKGQEPAAIEDCNKGLEVNPRSRELLWLSGELKKPAAKRFKGKLATPPGKK